MITKDRLLGGEGGGSIVFQSNAQFLVQDGFAQNRREFLFQ